MHKKWIVSAALIIISLSAYAQEYKRFKAAFGIPVSVITSDQFNYYGGFYLEPAWRWNDQWASGLYVSLLESDSQSDYEHLSETGSMLTIALTTDHYWKLDRIRPFYGLLVGKSSHLHEQIQRYRYRNGYPVPGDIIWISSSGYTVAPRVGFDFWHVRTLLMYQLTTHSMPDLLTVQIGLEIGGGRRKRN